MPKVFKILDTETTGLDPVSDRIIEIAAVEIIDRRVTGVELHSFVNPEGRKISYGSYEVHRINDADVADAPTFAEVWPRFTAFIGADPIVIQNQAFDLGFLNPAIERAGLLPITNQIIDSIDISREVWPGQRPSLDAILKRLGMFDEERAKKHGALVDSRLLAGAFARMLDLRDQPRVQSELLLTGAPSIGAAAAPLVSRPPRPIKAI